MRLAKPCTAFAATIALAAACAVHAEGRTATVIDFGGQSFEGWSGIAPDSALGRVLAREYPEALPAPIPQARSSTQAPVREARRCGEAVSESSEWAVPEYRLLAMPQPLPCEGAGGSDRVWEIPEYELLRR